MKRKRSKWSEAARAPSIDEVVTALALVVQEQASLGSAELIDQVFTLREFVIGEADRRRISPVTNALDLVDMVVEESEGVVSELTPEERLKIARHLVFCTGCGGYDGAHCRRYPGKAWDGLLARQVFCTQYTPSTNRGEVLPLGEADFRLSRPVKLLLLIPLFLLILLLVIWWILRIPLRLLWWILKAPLRLVWIGTKWIWRGIVGAARWFGGGIGRGVAAIRGAYERGAQVIEAVRRAVSEAPAEKSPETYPPPDLGVHAEELAEELEEVRREAERVRADLEERARTEVQDRDALRAEMGGRITDLETRLTGTQEKLRTVTKRAQMLGRLVRQQQEILDGKARSARRLAVGKRRLGRQLKEAVSLIPEDALISTEEALNIEHLLEVAESELEERDDELVEARADLDDALAELETYDQQLAIAEQRARDLAAALAAGRATLPVDEPVAPIPRRIDGTDVVASRRFAKEFDELPVYLRPFVAARLRLLLEHPDLLERRTYLVGEADRAAYRLPKKEGLRKCRLNVKYRMFLVAQGPTVELISVSKHA